MFEKEKELFGELLIRQIERIDKIKLSEEITDYKNKKKIIIGICGGDGIGPIITLQAKKNFRIRIERRIGTRKNNFKRYNRTNN